jgi:hypothetical protein
VRLNEGSSYEDAMIVYYHVYRGTGGYEDTVSSPMLEH